jgi:hypothetical protein
MNNLKISHTIIPEKLPFNKWMHHVVTCREELSNILNPTSKRYQIEELNKLTIKNYLRS